MQPGLVAYPVEQIDLVPQVQGADRLVQQHHLGFAHQHLGKEHQLPLPPTQGAQLARGQVADAHFVELAQRPLQQGVVQVQGQPFQATHGHRLQHRQRRLGMGILGHVGHALAPAVPLPAQRSPRHQPPGAALDLAGRQRQVTGQGAQQGGLAGAIGAEDHMHLPCVQFGAESGDHGAIAALQREVLEADHRLDLRGAKMSQSRKGTPTMAVTMPTGNSAPGRIDLDSTEAKDSIRAPQMADSGSRKR